MYYGLPLLIITTVTNKILILMTLIGLLAVASINAKEQTLEGV